MGANEAMRTFLRVGAAAVLAAACQAPTRGAPEAERAGAPPRGRCEVAYEADFEGAGLQALERYVAELTRVLGPPAGLQPGAVTLEVARSEPKPGPSGMVAGEIACGNGRYRITLFRKALAGRPLNVAYQTTAHEFFHVVQIRRDGLHCGPAPGRAAHYEREAQAFAEQQVPRCR